LFRLTFAERIAESKIQTQRNAQRKFSLSDQKRHFTFWIKFGLSLKFGLSERLSERLIQKVKSPTIYTFSGALAPEGILPGAKFTLHPSLAFSCISSVTARHSSSGCQPNFAAWYKEWYKEWNAELSQKAPPIFGRAKI